MSSVTAPKISIVMTLYETYHFLPRAFAGVMQQNYANWELILVSDGPAAREKYDPRRIFRTLQRGFPSNRAEFHELPRAPGCYGNAARAFGLTRAEGDYVCWVNHDNLISPDYLRTHARNIRRRPGCLSVVDIDLWKEERYRGRFPRGYRCGKIDLLCYALPTEIARELEAFGPEVERLYAADGKLFEAAARVLSIEHERRLVGTHF